ncbi:hypothetical protein CYY_002759 [Polysphondylium violaceum]|uniref:Tetratricopeptide repeat protein n=1 Tax=Polysphondylium violaceum TaxID=133409 RepID=A0A8J4Q7K8_9MYCE|nr:hypothetical protein CYY_002759 [Polysphondylium violaceum]
MATKSVNITPTLLLLEKLSTINQDQQGNTPIPSKAMMMFIGAMNGLRRNAEGIEKKLDDTLVEAEKGKDKEEIAVVLLGLGYFHYTKTNYPKSLEYYNKSLSLWKQIHGDTNIRLADLLKDIAVLYDAVSNTTESKKVIAQYEQLFKINGKEIPK